uniref:uncharacterized protein LOC122582440 n=1 Tax=Erigeron canadensis TaxID=72917 RepID=UPI001CB9A908|nr:uncharacterized protein LOC122582440 [Erigeron canadensis]
MEAPATYYGIGNHRYFSGETVTPTATNLTFEFNEFDIWNAVAASSPEFHKNARISKKPSPSPSPANRENHRMASSSLPVDVPDWSMILKNELPEHRRINIAGDDEFDEDDEFSDDRIPPHEYLAKLRIASLSVHEGIGRTLKGRDLSRVRNAVWKQIGFED